MIIVWTATLVFLLPSRHLKVRERNPPLLRLKYSEVDKVIASNTHGKGGKVKEVKFA